MRHRYEQSIQERNDLGLQLIERNEEVCVFYEKLNVQESIIRQANLELTAREEELKFLRIEVGGVSVVNLGALVVTNTLTLGRFLVTIFKSLSKFKCV